MCACSSSQELYTIAALPSPDTAGLTVLTAVILL